MTGEPTALFDGAARLRCKRERVRFKRSVCVKGHKTSVTLEDRFWECFQEIGLREGGIPRILYALDGTVKGRGRPNLSAAIRQYVLEYYTK